MSRITDSEATAMSADCEQEDGKLGVLLYYKYTPVIEDLNELYNFYESNCSSLGLLGRVRIAAQGVNVTIGGRLSSLKKHIETVKENSLFEGTDFKLATCDVPLEDDRVAKECGFTSLSIRIVKELVTLSANPLLKSPAIANAGRHLSAVEFHSVLQGTGELLEGKSPIKDNRLVLVDARNLYETRIGKFETPHVETLDPAIRQYSDLPAWIDGNVEQLRNASVLMYCTGGIRCEMASAYIRSKGAGFENVFQLYGGIQRYLEQFPDGGYFKGKNFVFDHRIAVGPSNCNITGKCLLCGSSYDDYSSRCRCKSCRMLVLVCESCQKESAQYICELCWRNGKGAGSVQCSLEGQSDAITDIGQVSTDQKASLPLIQDNGLNSRSPGVNPLRKLRIMCLHGFRQNASSFKGRTASLAKKLKGIAELIFVNAPHELPFIYQSNGGHENCTSSSPHLDPVLSKNCNKRYAWLVGPDYYGKKAGEWERIDTPFDPQQYQQQTEGFHDSLAYLRKIFSQEGPFDGILGFSQGAAMTALICAQRGRCEVGIDVRFVIMCSGFAVNLASCGKSSIHCPSLHVYGKDVGKDRQISSESSRHLASFFEDGCRVIIEHDSGHIIPTRSPYIEEVRNFLGRFQ